MAGKRWRYECTSQNGKRVTVDGREDEPSSVIKARASTLLGGATISNVKELEPIKEFKERKPRAVRARMSDDDISKIKIEKNIPIPERKTRGRRWNALLEKMKDGESVTLPTQECGSFKAAAQKLLLKIVIRAADKEGQSRCWRSGKLTAAPADETEENES